MNFVHYHPNYCISLMTTFHNLISVTTITKKSIRDLLYNFCTRFLSLNDTDNNNRIYLFLT